MPFDATPITKPSIEVRLIDKALAILGPNGEHWLQEQERDYRGNYCLIGALESARSRLRTRNLIVLSYVQMAIYEISQPDYISLARYNDDYERNFAEIRSLLLRARQYVTSEVKLSDDCIARLIDIGVRID